MPDISSASVSKAVCHVHDFRLDSLKVFAENNGSIWLDEDTLDYLEATATRKGKFGIFELSLVEHASYHFTDSATFMSFGVDYPSIDQHIDETVTMKIKGKSLSHFSE